MNTQHMGKTAMQPCPIARNRRRIVAAAALLAVGLVDGNALADAPVQQVGAPPVLTYRVALPVVSNNG